ncbi:MAG: transposase [Rhodobacteraceae bacterium]|nr:transposase [Paracoccaceae bacterium]
MKRQSGRWRGKAFIQSGRKSLRNALYMPAPVAIRVNPDMTARYVPTRANGKAARAAITATMRKLFKRASALITDNRKWAAKNAGSRRL